MYRYLLRFRMPKAEDAGERRTRELKAIATQGFCVSFEGPGKVRVGRLYIWPYSGRWTNEGIGQSGRIHQLTMRQLIEVT
jgi:hypothetical protein